jgi:hypothetical protein
MRSRNVLIQIRGPPFGACIPLPFYSPQLLAILVPHWPYNLFGNPVEMWPEPKTLIAINDIEAMNATYDYLTVSKLSNTFYDNPEHS